MEKLTILLHWNRTSFFIIAEQITLQDIFRHICLNLVKRLMSYKQDNIFIEKETLSTIEVAIAPWATFFNKPESSSSRTDFVKYR